MRIANICSKTFQPRIKFAKLYVSSTFTAYEKHMQSMNSVLLCRKGFRATCDNMHMRSLPYAMLIFALDICNDVLEALA